MTKDRPLREICGALARIWVLTKRPGKREPDRFEHYVYVDKRWVRVIVEFNGEIEKPPRRRKDDKDEDDLIAD